MKIITEVLSTDDIKHMAEAMFGNLVKAAVDAELYSDLEALLINNGSKQSDIWGINLYPDMKGDDFVEFDSMINIRPSQNNMIRGVSDEEISRKIIDIINMWVKR